MSGPRLYLGRLPWAACLASALLALCGLASCTKPTPGYCDMSTMSSPCGEGMRCDFDAFTCVTVGVDNDAGTDGRVDSPEGVIQGDANDDHPVTTDGANDGRDAGGESPVDGPRTCPGGCAADGGTPICDPSSGTCVGCLGDTQCPRGPAHVCDTVAKRCVQCLAPKDCTTATAPVCDTQTCRGCRTDADCLGVGPEVCMVHIDGHCATDDETVYVKNDVMATCSNDPSAGSRTVPFCESQLAIDAAMRDPSTSSDASTASDAGPGPAPIKSLVVMRGPDPMANWTLDTGSRILTVVGKAGAWISPGPHDGVTLTSGTLYLRGDLRIGGATNGVGIRATGGKLVADRLLVDHNNLGGIFLDHAAFAITNTIIAANGQSQNSALATWSGIIMDNVPTSGPSSLINNTIVGNMTGAVVCAGVTSPARLSGLVLWNNQVDFIGCGANLPAYYCCGTDTSNQPLNPLLDATYRLTLNSPCINKLPVANSTPYDIDGQPRTGTMVDCGADEFVSTMP